MGNQFKYHVEWPCVCNYFSLLGNFVWQLPFASVPKRFKGEYAPSDKINLKHTVESGHRCFQFVG